MKIVLLGLLFAAALLWKGKGKGKDKADARRPFAATGQHFRRLYTRRNFFKLGLAVGGLAILAYSGADEEIEAAHTRELTNETTGKVAHFFHEFGERYWFLYWLLFALSDGLVRSTALTRWGRRSFEAMLVGLPALWTVQRVGGASRPSDNTHGPRFSPFDDDNTASGHAFISAIPFFTAMHMFNIWPAKLGALLLAPGTGWSRIHDRKHYLSQVLLGWGIAFESTRAICPPKAVVDHED